MRLSSLLHRGTWLASCLTLAIGCANSGPVAPPEPGTPPDAGGSTDGGVAFDGGGDAAVPPACVDATDCDDGDACTEDTCVAADGGVCVHDNPLADCARFDGLACAGDIATSLLTVDQSFCIPGFAMDVPYGSSDGGVQSISISLCQGQKCDPADTQDGCLVTLTSEGDPASSPDPNTLHVSGRITGVEGTIPFSGVIPDPAGGGGTVALSCNVSISVGSGLPMSADLALTRAMACGTDRSVNASVNVDLSALDVKLTGATLWDLLACAAADTAISSQLTTLLDNVQPRIEAGIGDALSALDCGACDIDCPADLVCILPAPLAGP